MNTDELAIVPVAPAQAMFNSNTLFRILVEARNREAIELAKEQVAELIKQRHDGEEDVTVITQDAVLATFDRLLGTLTLGVAGIAAISLAVAGILVMNVMLVSVVAAHVRDRPAEGARARPAAPCAVAFLTEAAMLSLPARCIGYGLGQRRRGDHPRALPDAAGVSAGLGGARRRSAPRSSPGSSSASLPARRAAALDPVRRWRSDDLARRPSSSRLRAITAHRLRSFLTLLGIAVGIAAVILLTSIGEGIHRFVLAEFTQFGTNVVGIAPGRVKTGGGPPSGLPTAVRPLTFDDARALQRLPHVTGVAPSRVGQFRGRRQRPPAAHHRLRRQRGRAAGVQHEGEERPVPARRGMGKRARLRRARQQAEERTVRRRQPARRAGAHRQHCSSA